MKKFIFSSLLTAFACLAAFAQPGDGGGNPERRKEKMEAFRVAFFTERLSLNEEEAKGFWPIWNEFRDARQKLHDQYGPEKDIDSMTDREVEEHINKSIEQDQRELDLKKEYLARLRKVLPPRKVARLQGIERDFKQALLQKLSKKEGMKPGPGGKRNR